MNYYRLIPQITDPRITVHRLHGLGRITVHRLHGLEMDYTDRVGVCIGVACRDVARYVSSTQIRRAGDTISRPAISCRDVARYVSSTDGRMFVSRCVRACRDVARYVSTTQIRRTGNEYIIAKTHAAQTDTSRHGRRMYYRGDVARYVSTVADTSRYGRRIYYRGDVCADTSRHKQIMPIVKSCQSYSDNGVANQPLEGGRGAFMPHRQRSISTPVSQYRTSPTCAVYLGCQARPVKVSDNGGKAAATFITFYILFVPFRRININSAAAQQSPAIPWRKWVWECRPPVHLRGDLGDERPHDPPAPLKGVLRMRGHKLRSTDYNPQITQIGTDYTDFIHRLHRFYPWITQIGLADLLASHAGNGKLPLSTNTSPRRKYDIMTTNILSRKRTPRKRTHRGMGDECIIVET